MCVRWYLSYKLSSRDLAQMMEERGIEGTHDDFAIGAAVRPGIRETLEPLRTNGWRVVALRGDLYKGEGRWTYVYRAVDKTGRIVAFWLSERRDVAAA